MNKNRYKILRNGKEFIFAGTTVIITGKKKAQEWVDQHNRVARDIFGVERIVYTMEKVEE